MGRNLLILIVLIACASLLKYNERYKGNDPVKDHLVQNLPNRGVVMQFTQSREQVIALLGDPDEKDPKNPDEKSAEAKNAEANWATMARQQYIDFVFIPLYWVLFFFALSGPMRRSGNSAGRILGRLAAICITAAAFADYVEDFAILHALGKGEGNFWPWNYSATKWTFFYLTMGISSLLFLLYPKLGSFGETREGIPSWLRWTTAGLRWATGLAFVAGSTEALIAIPIILSPQRDGEWLAWAQKLGIGLGFLLLLLFFVVSWIAESVLHRQTRTLAAG